MGVDPVSIGVQVAVIAASMAVTASQKFEGPRLDDTNVSLADYGTPLPRFWGIRRFQTQIIWAEKLREKKKTSKTKGGKYANYKYFGTFAVVIADQEIDAITRIWLDKRLVYDVTKPGPISIATLVTGGDGYKLNRGKNMRVYLGTEDQEPDPRMEAWCEDRYGPDSCPAYRGVSYIVFEELPLEKFGNRIPQITVEAVSADDVSYPWESKDTAYNLDNFAWSADFSRFIAGNGGALEIWDAATRSIMYSGAVPSWSWNPAIDTTGAVWMNGATGLEKRTADGTRVESSFPMGFAWATDICVIPQVAADIFMADTVCIVPNLLFHQIRYLADGVVNVVDVDFAPRSYFTDGDGNAWAGGGDTFSSNVGVYCFKGPRIGEGVTFPSPAGTPGQLYVCHNGAGSFVFNHGGHLFLLDDQTWTTSAIVIAPVTNADGRLAFATVQPGDATFWMKEAEISLTTLEVVQTINPSNWLNENISGGTTYDPINHALISWPLFAGSHWTWRYLDRVGSSGVTLQTVVDDVSDWCQLTGQDTSALTQTVAGYSVTQGSGKDMIAPLLDIHDVDVRPHDFSVQFIVRGASSGGTIATSDFVRQGDDPRYVVSMAQDTDLPRKITLNFADVGKDQQTNTAIAQRSLDAVDSVREVSIDLTTYAEDPANAQQFVDRYHRRAWFGREKISLSLTAQQLHLEPGDVRTLSLDGISRKARLTKLTLAGGVLETEWERDDPAVHVLSGNQGAEMEGRDPEVILIPVPTKAFVLDIPLVTDSDSSTNPLLYYAAAPYMAGMWGGASILEDDAPWNDVASTDAATWGYATTALGDADPWLWDRGNTVNVKGYGALSSVTEAEINADPDLNLAYFGGELLNFCTATLETDGSYTLSGFKRGRRGTEAMVSTHVIGDEFVLVADLATEAMGLSEVGTDLEFTAGTLGRPASQTIDEHFDGATLMPYAPARVVWSTDGTDLTGTIIRRTRVGGAWVGGTTIPLSENSEAYEVDIYSGSTLKRTIAVTGTNTFAYTAADMATDGIAFTADPDAIVYQMSDAVGRGFPLAA